MKEQRLYLIHMLEAIDRILEYTAAGKAAFMQDRRTQDAVVRNFEIMGEATKRIGEETRARDVRIPGEESRAVLDILIHSTKASVVSRGCMSIVEQDLALPSLFRLAALAELIVDGEPGRADAAGDHPIEARLDWVAEVQSPAGLHQPGRDARASNRPFRDNARPWGCMSRRAGRRHRRAGGSTRPALTLTPGPAPGGLGVTHISASSERGSESIVDRRRGRGESRVPQREDM